MLVLDFLEKSDWSQAFQKPIGLGLVYLLTLTMTEIKTT